jgi:putative tricarboxylic transport membrane protein
MNEPQAPPNPTWHLLARKNVLAGLMFIGVALVGLWESRHYPVGTALRMGTGYVPRLLCWVMIGLGGLILIQGAREAAPAPRDGWRSGLRPVFFVTASLVIFGLTIELLGLVVSIFLLIAIGAVAARALKPIETLIAAIVLIVLSWAIFIVGLGLTIPIWPEF